MNKRSETLSANRIELRRLNEIRKIFVEQLTELNKQAVKKKELILEMDRKIAETTAAIYAEKFAHIPDFTVENFDRLIERRDVRDELSKLPHPFPQMDNAGHNFFDYAVYKRKKHQRPVLHIIKEINEYFRKGVRAKY